MSKILNLKANSCLKNQRLTCESIIIRYYSIYTSEYLNSEKSDLLNFYFKFPYLKITTTF